MHEFWALEVALAIVFRLSQFVTLGREEREGEVWNKVAIMVKVNGLFFPRATVVVAQQAAGENSTTPSRKS